MLSEALSYPTEDDDWVRPILIGSGIMFASFLFGFAVIPLYGYFLRVMDAGRTGSRELPQFDDWEELIVDGIKMFAVNFVYVGVPTGVLFFVGFFAVLSASIGLDSGAGGSGGAAIGVLVVVGALLLIGGLLYLVGAVLAPAALAHMRAEGELVAAFRFRTVVSLALDKNYLVAVTLAWFVGGAISLVGALFAIVLIGLPVLVFGGMVSFHLFGQGYQRARARHEGRRPGAQPRVDTA
jgi:hypothetical protein